MGHNNQGSARREVNQKDSVVDAGGVKIGGGNFAMIAGPCSIESLDQVLEVAKRVRDAGADILRGGAFKARTSPYDFQGLKADGIEMLLEAKRLTGLPIITEIVGMDYIDLYRDVDIIQVGARNMQNFELLTALGKLDKPILLKRGMASTIDELLSSAEYIMAGGNNRIILCERGIRTFEPYTRNTFDVSAIPALHQLTHLPVIADPSHATGRRSLVEPVALAATAAGADGVMVEVHNKPEEALCDGSQSLRPWEFSVLSEKLNRIRNCIGSGEEK